MIKRTQIPKEKEQIKLWGQIWSRNPSPEMQGDEKGSPDGFQRHEAPPHTSWVTAEPAQGPACELQRPPA